ncbi:PhzF family phenazine biosynthesis protein [Terracidiphilus sp.]|jgi:trans-2,3-dihydro-3-hydroxyanthranilate isomerase|uniref:PhzF family phenazine biosynthesis protein n=1 Tax=Terracidiphilus sp. TaxID=1964191 RepID=UPI003C1405A6
MPELDYFIVDVFTDRALAGNPLAVVMNNANLSTEQMQSIAREFNLSETTFVERRATAIEAAEGIRTRIFTTEEELPFAGHPTLGTASVLKIADPSLAIKNTIILAENVGPIPVAFDPKRPGTSNQVLFGEMTQRDPECGPELESARVAELIGLTLADLDPAHPPQIVSTGNGFAIVLLRSLDALSRLNVRQHEATDYLRPLNGRWFYVIAPEAESFRARMQFYGGEDPATGSAAGCAISYLVARRIVPFGQRIHVRQGVEMGRPSDLFLRANLDTDKVTNVRVGGSTVLVATGRLQLP